MNKQLIFKYIKYHTIPYIFTLTLLFVLGTNKWAYLKQPFTIGWITFVALVVSLAYYCKYKFKCISNKELHRIHRNENGLKKYFPKSIDFLGIISTIVTTINFSPSIIQITVAVILIVLAILFSNISAKYNLHIASNIFSIAVLGIILFNMTYQVSYSGYSLQIDNAFKSYQSQNFSVALEQFDNILKDKYFQKNYNTSLLPTVVKAKENIKIEKHQDLEHFSTSISSPIKIKNGYLFNVTFIGKDDLGKVKFTKNEVALNGFDADIEVTNAENNKYLLKLTNIKGSSGNKKIRIIGGIFDITNNKISYPTPETVSFLYINSFEILWLSVLCCVLIVTTNIFFILSLHKENNNA